MTMLEKVAKAICKQDYDNEKGWERYTLHAKAAVEALRELDDKTLEAAFPGGAHMPTLKRPWIAMIDAILKND